MTTPIQQVQESDRWRRGGVLLVLLLFVLGLLVIWWASDDGDETGVAAPPVPSVPVDEGPVSTPEATPASTVEMAFDDDRLVLRGVVVDRVAADGVVGAATEAFPETEIVDELTVGSVLGEVVTVVVSGEVRDPETAADNLAAADAIVALFDSGVTEDRQTVRNTAEEQSFEDALNELVTAEPIEFETGSAELSPASTDTLDRVVELVLANPGVPVLLGGHTDDTGNRDANVALSEARAESVRAYLVDNGVEADRLSTAGFGPDEPKVPNDSAEGRARNRRIEFTVNPE